MLLLLDGDLTNETSKTSCRSFNARRGVAALPLNGGHLKTSRIGNNRTLFAALHPFCQRFAKPGLYVPRTINQIVMYAVTERPVIFPESRTR